MINKKNKNKMFTKKTVKNIDKINRYIERKGTKALTRTKKALRGTNKFLYRLPKTKTGKAVRHMARKIGSKAYQFAKEVGREQNERGFYDFEKKRMPKKNKDLHRRKVKVRYVYYPLRPRRTKVRRVYNFQKKKHRTRTGGSGPNFDPFRLPF